MRAASSYLSMARAQRASKLYVALLVLLNPDVRREGAVIHDAVVDSRLLHGQQLAACQSVEAVWA
eukprot:11169861-Lingulodinium_polyedra.AAC.1